MIRKRVVLPGGADLHMRAANIFAECAGRYRSTVRVARGELVINGKSIMGLMMLAAPSGAELMIEAEGPDEEEAVQELVELVRMGFGERLRSEGDEAL